MIQRLQTLWLLMASMLAFASLKVPFFSGNIMIENLKQFQRFTAMGNIFLMILTVAVAIASLIAVFLYKDRQLQLKISMAVFVLSLINLVLFYLETKKFIPTDWSFNLTAITAFTIPVFLLMAIRGIYRDEKLIKSVDRLR